MIDEQSSASGLDYALDRSAIGAGHLEMGDNPLLFSKHPQRVFDKLVRNHSLVYVSTAKQPASEVNPEPSDHESYTYACHHQVRTRVWWNISRRFYCSKDTH